MVSPNPQIMYTVCGELTAVSYKTSYKAQLKIGDSITTGEGEYRYWGR